MKKQTKRNTVKSPKTLSELAEVLGVSRQLLNAHRKKPDAPKLGDVSGWTTWLAQHGREGSAPPQLREAIAKERLKILRETDRKLKRENDVASGLLMERAEAKRENAKAWAFIFEQLENRLCNQLPPILAGRSAVEIFEQLSEFKELMRKTAKEKFEKAA